MVEGRRGNIHRQDQQKRKLVTSNSMLTCILRKGLNKKHNSVVKSFYADTCEKVLEVLKDLLKEKLDWLTINLGTNDLTNGVNLSNHNRSISFITYTSFKRDYH